MRTGGTILNGRALWARNDSRPSAVAVPDASEQATATDEQAVATDEQAVAPDESLPAPRIPLTDPEILPTFEERIWQTLWLLFVASGLILVADLEGVLTTSLFVEWIWIARVLILAGAILILAIRPTRAVTLTTGVLAICTVAISVAAVGVQGDDWASGAIVAVALSLGCAALVPWGAVIHAILATLLLASLVGTSAVITGDPFFGMGPDSVFSLLLCMTSSVGIAHAASERRLRIAAKLREARIVEQRGRAYHAVVAAMHYAELGFIADRGPRGSFAGLLNELLALTNSRYGFIGELQEAPDGHRFLKCHAVSDTAWEDTSPALREKTTRDLEFHNFDNLFGQVLTDGKTVVSNDPASDTRRRGLPEGHPRLKNFLGLPLVSGGEVVGMVGLANRRRDYDSALITRVKPLVATCAQIARSCRFDRLRQRAEEEVRQFNATLEARVDERSAELDSANRVLSRLSTAIAHDLRQPLRAITSFSQLLVTEYGGALDDTGQDYLQRVFVAGGRMEVLINSLLALARLGRAGLVFDTVDLSTLARGVVAELASNAPERAVDVVVAPGLTAVGDAGLLRVLLENLIENAWKFTRKESRAKIEVGAETRDGEQVFYVRDNGAGFDMRFAGKLFHVFERLHVDPLFEGTGIGLAMVESIVRRHKGRVWAVGAPGEGATFHFTLAE